MNGRDPNSISVRYPLIAAQWHPSLNGDLLPSQVTAGSKLKAHWLCTKCGHTWQARVGSRTRGHGCPACARRTTGLARSSPEPGESLAERDPDVAAEWHPILNGELTPNDVGCASNKKVWWLCRNCGHEWQVQVANRRNGSSCRRCAAADLRRPKPGGSLSERNPDVAAEWHPTLNGELHPNDVAFSAKAKAWWKCADCGNEWEAFIGNRARGAGCPPCSRKNRSLRHEPTTPRQKQVVSADTSLSRRFPDVAAQWHPSRNGDRTPDDFLPGSNVRVWWLCPTCGHEWEAVIQSRTRGGAGCPPCGRRRAGAALAKPKPGQSLAELNPELAAQWHPTRNGDLTPLTVAAKSGKRAWWLCPACANEWEATIGSRADGSGCKACATAAAAIDFAKPHPGQSLADEDPELSDQWHPTRNGAMTPEDVAGNSGQTVWWQCSRGHEWKAMINNRTKARGCPQCTLWGTSVEEIRLRSELVAAGVPIDATHEIRHPVTGRNLMCDMVVPEWNIVIEFDGNRFHKTTEGHAKDRRKTEALRAAGWTVVRVREGLDLIGPDDVVVPILSSEVVRTKAVLVKLKELGHRAEHHDQYLAADEPWAAAAANDEVRRPRSNSLSLQSPALAAEWDVERNTPLTPDDVSAGSGHKAWWLCPECGHGWRAAIYSRANGHGCPECGKVSSHKNRKPKLGNSLTERCPDIAAEWHPTRNGDQTADLTGFGSHKEAWWLCAICGTEFEAVVNKRSSRGTGCPAGCHRR